MEKNFIICYICENDASNLCFDCMMYFCETCYKLIHDKKKSGNHKKEKLDFFVPIELRCHNHPKIFINLFCMDDKGKNYFI